MFYAALFRFREKWQYLDKEDARIVGVRSTEQSVWHLLPPNIIKETGERRMLKWQRNYMIDDKIKKPREIKEKLDEGKFVHGIYLITMSENPSNIMDIIPAFMLIQQSFYDICPPVIGMAKGKKNALEMVRELIDKTYRTTGSFCVAEYLENR